MIERSKKSSHPAARGIFCYGPIYLISLLAPNLLSAHETPVSYSALVIEQDRLQAEFTFDQSDLIKYFQLDVDQNQNLDALELLAGRTRVNAYILAHVEAAADYRELTLKPRDAGSPHEDAPNRLVNFRFMAKLDWNPGELSLRVDFSDRLGPEHVNFATVTAGRQVQQRVLARNNSKQRFKVGGKPPLSIVARQFVWLGGEHIFIGYDHLLFLLALVLPGEILIASKRNFKNLIKIVTAFTIAHSITLTLTVLNIIFLPPQLIETGIALSIVYVAAENFWLTTNDHRWLLTFLFGLIHGFGFANVLRGMGLPEETLVATLFSFNIGVELGQICIVALLFPFTLWLARQPFQRMGVQMISAVILLCGLGWLINRAASLQLISW